MSADPAVVNLEAEAIKEKGNVAFKAGNLQLAEELYSQAIELDGSNAKYLVNRALCYASLLQWDLSYEDAKRALALDAKSQKAHFRLIKALFEMSRFKEARLALLAALKECGETKDNKALEEDLLVRTGIPLRPKSTDFEIVGELGDGNFSKVYKAQHKATDRVFAIKTIEKMTVDRMKKRHGNINNEILMEKRALNRLDHPGIVQLYNTFQDYGTLYYQMEFVGGRDLWDRLHEVQLTGFLSSAGTNTSGENAPHAQVGCHWSLARFYLAEAINAVEHMHRRGIAHRDIKPENMIISADGHLKFIDFGTAKDLIQTDLNGPEFVGTPEYLSPSTVRNQTCGIEVDLWALGVVLFQMLLGYTPYGGPSPYLTFLRIKRSFLQIPDWVPAPLASMIRLLLQSDPKARLRSACGVSDSATLAPGQLSYDALRGHEMFRNAHSTCVDARQAGGDSAEGPAGSAVDELSTVDGVRTVYDRSALKVPTLREICLRASGRAALLLAAAIAENGGSRPTSPAWMTTFDLMKLPSLDRAQIQHYLLRQQRLHTPGVYRLFCSSLVEARSRRSDLSTGQYLGMTRQLQGHWDKDFFFLQLSAPLFGAAAAVVSPSESASSDLCNVEAEEKPLRELLSSVNKLRPRFLVMIGDLTHSSPADGTVFDAQVEALRKTMARVSDTIPVVYCPGSHDVGPVPTVASLQAYRARFGADYFGFWYGGMRGLVINSSLLISPQGAPEEAARQETWLTEEIEQSKLCSNSVLLFSYHPWFLQSVDEPDCEVSVAAGGTSISAGTVRTIPRAARMKWLSLLRHHKVKLAISSRAGEVHLDGTTSSGVLRPFPRRKGGKQQQALEEEVHHAAPHADMKPSEMIAHGLATGELSAEDVKPEDHEVHPPAPPTAAEEAASAASATETEAGEQTPGAAEEDSDRDSDYEPEGGEEVDSAAVKKKLDEAAGVAEEPEEEEVFLNIDEECEGPEMLTEPTAAILQGCTGLRAVYVHENDVAHKYFAAPEVPKTLGELLQIFE